MEKKAWKPSLTSQFYVCPIPFHLDTYRGCVYNCNYCFARDFITFSRRNSEHTSSKFLVANDPESFARWMNKVDKIREYDYEKGNEVAIKERIPLKLGATADPFPPAEATLKTTLRFLRILDYFDYPVEIQTKNPEVLNVYADEFKNPNWTIAVSLITMDEAFNKVCEPNATKPSRRIEAIKRLTDSGKKVMVKLQPSIYPKVVADLPDLVEAVSEAGCWALNTEGLKLRVTMPQSERELFSVIGNHLSLDLFEYYKANGLVTGSDREIRTALKMEYTQLAKKLTGEYGIKYYPADNDILGIGDGCECCGTEVLKDYKIYGNNIRSKAFKPKDYESKELGKCVVNFTRSRKNINLTMDEVVAEKESKKEKEVSPPLRQSDKAEAGILHNIYGGFNEKEPRIVASRGRNPDNPSDRTTGSPTEQRLEPNSEGTTNSLTNVQKDNWLLQNQSIRRLTPTECERLQGFPDGWTKYGLDKSGNQVEISDTQRYKCLGNAVTTNVVTAIGEQWLKALHKDGMLG